MRSIISQVVYFLASENRKNLRHIVRIGLIMTALVILYSALFNIIMSLEGRSYSVVSSLYWTLSVMSTLGFGDITFTSDLGRMFTLVVNMTGIVLIMLVLPFAFIRFVYIPWMDAKTKAAVPTRMPDKLAGHVIVAGMDSAALAVVDRLRQYGIPYVYILSDQVRAMPYLEDKGTGNDEFTQVYLPQAAATQAHVRALELHEKGYTVMLGELDAAQTYKLGRVEQAALVAALCDDLKNTNIAATVRSIAPDVRIAGSVDHVDSMDILQLAGCNYTYRFTHMLGEGMARRVFQPGTRSNVIAVLGDLCIVEVPAHYTPYEGKTLKDTDLRSQFELTAVGVWHGKEYVPALPETAISSGSFLLLAGTAEQVRQFDSHLARNAMPDEEPVLILGGGRVGMAVARALEKRGITFRLVEKNPAIVPGNDERFITGSAADIETLKKAGIEATHTAIVTTHSDDLNIYLTIYCRKLRPDIQIISRANAERNVGSLYGAGANLVMSHATMAANTITNLLRPGRVIMLTEGLNLFRVTMPASLVGVALKDSDIRQKTRCNVVAVAGPDGMRIPPDPAVPLTADDELILIGTAEAERSFMAKYPHPRR